MTVNLKKIATDKFSSIYSDMQKQFPQSEMKSYEVFLKLIDDGKYHVLAAYDREILVGYVIFAEIEDVIWLDYIAVLEELHSKGYGSKILNELKNIHSHKIGCILEVECSDESEPNTLRRIKFYENLGAKKLPVDYFYPNEKGDIKLDLYMIPHNQDCDFNIKEVIADVFELLHSELPHFKEVLDKISVNE